MREIIISIATNSALALIALILLFFVMLVFMWLRFYLGRSLDYRAWRRLRDQEKSLELSTVKQIEVTPLFEWEKSTKQYICDAGISYFIKTDTSSIIFDLGDNPRKTTPSPLYLNMKAAGFEPEKLIEDVDAIVISHRHPEHMGGKSVFNSRKANFDIPLPEQSLYTPWSKNFNADLPRQIATGIGLSEVLPGRTVSTGKIGEWMLLINLEGKGLVCVVADAHPDPLRMIFYANQITGITPYAYVGGVNALLPDAVGWPRRLWVGRRKPWEPRQPDEIGLLAVSMQELGIKKVFVSAHDSDHMSLGIIQSVFGDDMQVLKVGEKITIT